MHCVRHWQPLMDTGHVGQSAGAAVGIGLGVADLEGEEETGTADDVRALDGEAVEEIVSEAEAEAEELGRESWVAHSEGGDELVLLAEEAALGEDKNVGIVEMEGEGTEVGVGVLDRELLADKVGEGWKAEVEEEADIVVGALWVAHLEVGGELVQLAEVAVLREGNKVDLEEKEGATVARLEDGAESVLLAEG